MSTRPLVIASLVGTLLQVVMVVAGHSSPAIAKLFAVGGMGLSLVLSILHKIIGESSEDEQVLHSIDRKLGSLVETVNAPGQLMKQFDEMKNFLKFHLERINVSLDQALKALAQSQ